MGVLMSKKQQVEKVQKCTAVVSAFQSGLKERASKQTDVETEENPAKISATSEEKNTEEAEKDDPDKDEGPSTSQQAAVPMRDECKVNEEAWSRLRDGKGKEPEELDKTCSLTPPTFVRPKREADDDQPVEIQLDKKEQPPSNEMCDVCEVWTADDLYPCRICTRVFHDGCLRELGYLRAEALQEMRDTAHTVTGWSCYYCNSLVRLLTAKERDKARSVFLGLDQDQDGLITRAECRQAQQSWFSELKDPQSCNVSISHVGPICENSPASSGSERSKADESRPFAWADFLRESAIYILAARPNSSAMHIRLPL